MKNKSSLGVKLIYKYLFIFLIFVSGCSKDKAILVNSPDQQTIRSSFYSQNLFDKLHYPFNSKTTLYWEPSWNTEHEQKDNKGISYVYVELKPKLRDNKTLRYDDQIKMSGVKQFLVAKRAGNSISYYVASYLYKELPKNKFSIGVPVADEIDFNAFTGTLLFKSLINSKVSVYYYNNGKLVTKSISNKKTTARTDGCTDYYTCYWYSYCDLADSGGHAFSNGTITYSQDECIEPEQCPCNSYCYSSWNLSNSQVDSVCSPDDSNSNDPPPGPGNYGNGYNYNGTTTFEKFDTECGGVKAMVNRQAAVDLETAAYYTTDGHMLLMPNVGSTKTTFSISFPYRNSDGKIIISGPYDNQKGGYDIDLTTYNSDGTINTETYTIGYAVHSHPVGGNYDSDNPSPEDKANASQYPNMKEKIVNENNIIDYDSNGRIGISPNNCR